MGSLILALRFLTVVPVPGRESAGPPALGRAAWWFPVVGLMLGGVGGRGAGAGGAQVRTQGGGAARQNRW